MFASMISVIVVRSRRTKEGGLGKEEINQDERQYLRRWPFLRGRTLRASDCAEAARLQRETPVQHVLPGH